VNITYQSRELLTDILYSYQWSLIYGTIIIISIMLIVNNIIVACITKNLRIVKEDNSFVRYMNVMILLILLLGLFITESVLSAEDNAIQWRNPDERYQGTIYNYEQLILPLDVPNGTAISFDSYQYTSHLIVTAISKIPHDSFMRKINLTSTFDSGCYTSNCKQQFYISEHGKLEFDIISSSSLYPFYIEINKSGSVVYRKKCTTEVIDVFMPNISGFYEMRLVNLYRYPTIKNCLLYTDHYDFSKVSLWSSTENGKIIPIEKPVPYLVLEYDYSPSSSIYSSPYVISFFYHYHQLLASEAMIIIFSVLCGITFVGIIVIIVMMTRDSRCECTNYCICGEDLDEEEQVPIITDTDKPTPGEMLPEY